MNKLYTIIQELEGHNEWFFEDLDMEHKNRLHEEIHILLKGKRKCVSILMHEKRTLVMMRFLWYQKILQPLYIYG